MNDSPDFQPKEEPSRLAQAASDEWMSTKGASSPTQARTNRADVKPDASLDAFGTLVILADNREGASKKTGRVADATTARADDKPGATTEEKAKADMRDLLKNADKIVAGRYRASAAATHIEPPVILQAAPATIMSPPREPYRPLPERTAPPAALQPVEPRQVPAARQTDLQAARMRQMQTDAEARRKREQQPASTQLEREKKQIIAERQKELPKHKEVNSVAGLEKLEALSTKLGVAVIVDFGFPGCPSCDDMELNVFPKVKGPVIIAKVNIYNTDDNGASIAKHIGINAPQNFPRIVIRMPNAKDGKFNTIFGQDPRKAGFVSYEDLSGLLPKPLSPEVVVRLRHKSINRS